MKVLRHFFASQARTDAPSLREIDPETVRGWQKQGGCLLIDVREDAEYRAERIPGTCLAPLSRLEQALPSLPTGAKAVFLCRSGARTRAQAGRLARCSPGEAYILAGGLAAWKACGFPVERG
jgi:rhodanese-related sulfurtransferase